MQTRIQRIVNRITIPLRAARLRTGFWAHDIRRDVRPTILIDQHIYQERLAKQGGQIQTEQHLWAFMLGSIIMPVSLFWFWFAWTAQSSVHWMIPIIAAASFGYASTDLC